MANEAKDQFENITFTSVPRENSFIKKADKLANDALDGLFDPPCITTPPEVSIRPIGFVSSPYKEITDAPRQGRLTYDESTIEIYPDYETGLEGLDKYEQLFILLWFNKSSRDQLSVDHHGRGSLRGVFATRSPNRPNPIGLTLVDLIAIQGRVLHLRGLDAIDGTPVLDIKPYYSEIDSYTRPGRK